jgi:hypothetical protein
VSYIRPTFQPYQWSGYMPASWGAPPPRLNAAVAWSASTAGLVVFGGWGPPTGYMGDTWVWDTSQWVQPDLAQSPPPRDGAALAHFNLEGDLVLFGGMGDIDEVGYSDTWVWSLGESSDPLWSQVTVTSSPPPRTAASLCFDGSGNALLFGGLDPSGNMLADTWLFDGSDWTEATPSSAPSPRCQSAMCFDENVGAILLHGGGDGLPESDLWLWDGTDWNQIATDTVPPCRAEAGMWFDESVPATILSGGFGWPDDDSGDTALCDTWAFDGTDWTQLELSSTPTSGNAVGSAFSSALGGALLLSTTPGKVFDDTSGAMLPLPFQFATWGTIPTEVS